MHVLVTGASGFVGSALVRHLASRGLEVTAVVRRPRVGWDASANGSVRVALREIGPSTDWADVLTGVDTVVHLAARVHVGPDDPNVEEYHSVNVGGTAQLATHAARAGVRRFIFVSTVKVHGESSSGRPIRETDPFMPGDEYAASKVEAESAVRRVADETGIETVTIRPPLVYGPGVRANFLQIMRAVARGVPLPLGRVENRRSMIYLGNLVSVLERCVVDGRAAGETFLVCDGPAVSTPELVRMLARAMGRRPRLVGVPPAWLRVAGVMTGRSHVVRRLCESFEVDGSRVSRVLDWHPPFSMEEGVEETVRWFRDSYR